MSEKFTVGYDRVFKVFSKADWFVIEDRFKTLERTNERIKKEYRVFAFEVDYRDKPYWVVHILTSAGNSDQVGDTFMQAVMNWKKAKKEISELMNSLLEGIEYEEGS